MGEWSTTFSAGRAGELVDLVERFEVAWREVRSRGELPRLSAMIAGLSSSRDALLELVPIDLEYRWSLGEAALQKFSRAAKASGDANNNNDDRLPLLPRLDDYARVYPELRPVEKLPVEIIAWEYRMRSRHGGQPRPSMPEYLAKYRQHGEALTRALREAETEAPASHRTPSPPVSPSPPIAPSPPAFTAVTARPTPNDPSPNDSNSNVLGGNFLGGNAGRAPARDPLAGASSIVGKSFVPDLDNHPRYRLIQLLGMGGMGAVYKAEHRVMQREVAIKVILQHMVSDPGLVERFHQEVRAAARLAHPHVVTAYDAEQAGNTHFLVMEFVEGTDLGEVVKARSAAKKGPLPIRHACAYIRQAALGLQHAHERGMVHRDIKPQNLILTPKGIVKILDFGLARFASERSTGGSLTGTNAMMGTPDYIAPEQARSARDADIRADLYSLGCTLWYLLTGRTVFTANDTLGKIVAHLEKKPPRLRESRPDAPKELEQIVTKLLEKEPRRRFQTPAELAAALLPIASGKPSDSAEIAPGKSGIGKRDGKPPPPALAPSPGVDILEILDDAVKHVPVARGPDPRMEIDILQVPGFTHQPPVYNQPSYASSNTHYRAPPEKAENPWPLYAALGVAAVVVLLLVVMVVGSLVPSDRGPVVNNPAANLPFASSKPEKLQPEEPEEKKPEPTKPETTPPPVVTPPAPMPEPPKVEPTPPEPTTPEPSPASDPLPDPMPDPTPGPALLMAPFDASAARASQQAWAKHLQRESTEKNGIGMEMVLIPAGEFEMGSPASERYRQPDEGLQHRVRITRPFYLGVHEVTQQAWQVVMGNNPSYFATSGGGKDNVQGLDTQRFPVEQVSWFDAVEYCNKLSQRERLAEYYHFSGIERNGGSINKADVTIAGGTGYRLPSEAEWEYACRAGTTTPFHFGEISNGTESNINGNSPYGTAKRGRYLNRTTTVGSYSANRFGLYDMHGNVWEWCEDWYDADAYKNRSGITPDPLVFSGGEDRRVLRGGAWNNYAWGTRSANRDGFTPDDRDNLMGFRLARTP